MYKTQLTVLRICQHIDSIILTCFSLLRRLTKGELKCFCVLSASLIKIDVTSVTANSEGGEHVRISASFENASGNNNVLHVSNVNDETRHNIPDEVSELSVPESRLDRQTHTHHTNIKIATLVRCWNLSWFGKPKDQRVTSDCKVESLQTVWNEIPEKQRLLVCNIRPHLQRVPQIITL